MSSQFQFELTSPERAAMMGPIVMVSVPGALGSYSVLGGHAPMVTGVAPGIVEIYDKDDALMSSRFFVTGGYCEVTTDRCTLLADDILDIDAFVRSDILDEIKDLTKKLDKLPVGESPDELEYLLAVATAKLQVMTK